MTMIATKNHIGWQADEDALLFEEVKRAREGNQSLKAVFERVSIITGRKPNSIRNYYYARIKEIDGGLGADLHNPAFIPFTDDEIVDLLRTVLSAQAKGQSVRACTLDMGDGDNRAMLRYQNKYRSLIKSNEQLVRSVMEDMQNEGLPTFDPYADVGKRKLGRPRRRTGNLIDVVGNVLTELDRVEGLDVSALFESLGTLAIAATRGSSEPIACHDDDDDVQSYRQRNIELSERIKSQERELNAQRDRFATLLSYFRQLMQINREFLGMTSVVKVSNLSTYIRALAENMENCEQLDSVYNI